MKIAELTQCPACDGKEIDTETDFAPGVCTACGLVLTEDVFSDLPDNGDQSDDQQPDSPDLEEDWQSTVSVQDSSDEMLVELLERTEDLGAELRIGPANKTKAGEFAKEAWVEGFTHGRSLDTVAAAAVFLACRVSGEVRPIDVVAEDSDIKTSLLHQTWRALAQEVRVDVGPPHPMDYIPFIMDRMELPASVGEKALTVLEYSDDQYSGNPVGVAAGAVYIATQEEDSEITYDDLGRAVGLTKETVWRRTEELRNETGQCSLIFFCGLVNCLFALV